jgi:hypothetical protein
MALWPSQRGADNTLIGAGRIAAFPCLTAAASEMRYQCRKVLTSVKACDRFPFPNNLRYVSPKASHRFIITEECGQ